MFHLAQTVWPRFGGDQANSSQSRISGPHTHPTWFSISLTNGNQSTPREKKTISGVIVMPDETLCVTHNNKLSSVSFDGTIHWQLDLDPMFPSDWDWCASLPTSLQTGEILLTLPDSPLVIDPQGRIKSREKGLAAPSVLDALQEICALDNSGYSPNITYSGAPILTGNAGEVYLLEKILWNEIGIYGYDIVPPVVYPDNSLGIAGYGNAGFCRTKLDGETHWKTSLRDADLLPALNHQQIAAVGSLNDQYSVFFNPEGTQIGEYNQAAKFAEYIDGGWVAFSKQRIARLTSNGRELWGCEISAVRNLTFVEQPIVDRDGYIFVRHQGGYLCFDPNGHNLFEVKLPEIPQGLMSIIAPNTLAYVVGDELFIGHS